LARIELTPQDPTTISSLSLQTLTLIRRNRLPLLSKRSGKNDMPKPSFAMQVEVHWDASSSIQMSSPIPPQTPLGIGPG
jgi:hypothetical protein